MQTCYEIDRIGDCTQCKTCLRFRNGDRIELTVVGVLELGKRIVNRGTVKGQMRKGKKKILIRVHWDGFPEAIIGQVLPTYIQKLDQGSMAFL